MRNLIIVLVVISVALCILLPILNALASSPAIISVSPNSCVQGEVLDVTIRGTCLSEASAVRFGSGITVNSFTVNSSTQITASIAIDDTAAVGEREVAVTTPDGTAALAGGFTIDPNSGYQDELPSASTTDTCLSEASVGGLDEDIVVDSAAATAACTVLDGAATVGDGDTSATTPGGTATPADEPAIPQIPSPTVTLVDPNSGYQGEALLVTIAGTNLTEATAVSLGADISVDSFIVDSATQITADITLDDNAAVGERDIAVTTPYGTGTLVGGFTVNYAPPSVITVGPNSGIQGQSLSVVITGTNLTEATAVSLGAGITVDSLMVDSETQITASIVLDDTAAIGTRNVSVTTPGGIATLIDGFTVMIFSGQIGTPMLVSPVCEASVPGSSVTFQWSKVLGAVDYKLLVSTSTNILDSSKYKINVNPGNVTSYIDIGYPVNGTRYYWWVWAYDADGNYSTWSEVSANGRWFASVSPIGTPTLVSPVREASVPGSSVTFQWTEVLGAVDYKLLVSTSTNILDSSGWKLNMNVGNMTSYVDTGYPMNGTRYYWWVWAYDADGNYSTWSEVSANGGWFTSIN